MYSAENILWIKNVKRDQGESWAYENVTCSNHFLLNWPTAKKRSAFTPNVGDIITLFQKPNRINGRRNYNVHLTHLVSPVSTDIIEDESSPNHKWCRLVRVIAIANPINAIPNPGHLNFFLPNRGLTNPIINLQNTLDLTETELKEHLWDLFREYLCLDLSMQIFTPEQPVGIFGELEGDIIVRKHILQEYRQRNSSIVQQAKNRAFQQGNGRILCNCCDFDFVQHYGPHGNRFIECHHKIPITQGQRITNLADLALVCSNCHRMLHRKNQGNNYYTVEELRALILNFR